MSFLPSPARNDKRAKQEKKSRANGEASLTSMIMACESLSDLSRLVRDTGTKHNYKHAAAAVNQGSKLMDDFPSDSDIFEFGSIVTNAENHLENMGGHELSHLIADLASCRYLSIPLLRRVKRLTPVQLSKFDNRALSDTIWGMATLCCSSSALIGELLKLAESRLSSFRFRDVCKIIWALAVFGNLHSASFLEQILSMAMEVDSTDDPIAKHQVLLFLLSLEAQDHVLPATKVDPRYIHLRRVCVESWMHQLAEEQQTNLLKTQNKVFKAIKLIPGCSEAIFEYNDGIFIIDIALYLSKGHKVAVEVDGPTHFLLNFPDKLNGSTVLRNRLLKQQGWTVVSVPVSFWNAAGKGERADYLAKHCLGGV